MSDEWILLGSNKDMGASSMNLWGLISIVNKVDELVKSMWWWFVLPTISSADSIATMDFLIA